MPDFIPSYSEALSRFPAAGDILFWAILIPPMVILLFFGRFALRALVNKRVKGVGVPGMSFGGIDQMKKKGMITEEEYKQIRRKLALRELERVQESEAGAEAGQMLRAIEVDPSLAKSLLPPSSEVARAAMAGLGNPGGAVEEAPSRQEDHQQTVQPAQVEPPSTVQGQPARQQPPPVALPAQVQGPPAQSPAGGSAETKELDTLFLKGLISKQEYDRLTGLLNKAKTGQ